MPHHRPFVGAKSQANADLTHRAAYTERHHSIHADRAEQESQNAQAAGEAGNNALGREPRALRQYVQELANRGHNVACVCPGLGPSFGGPVRRARSLNVQRGSKPLRRTPDVRIYT